MEEAGKMLMFLQKKGVGVASVELYSLSKSGRAQARVPGEKGGGQGGNGWSNQR